MPSPQFRWNWGLFALERRGGGSAREGQCVTARPTLQTLFRDAAAHEQPKMQAETKERNEPQRCASGTRARADVKARRQDKVTPSVAGYRTTECGGEEHGCALNPEGKEQNRDEREHGKPNCHRKRGNGNSTPLARTTQSQQPRDGENWNRHGTQQHERGVHRA